MSLIKKITGVFVETDTKPVVKKSPPVTHVVPTLSLSNPRPAVVNSSDMQGFIEQFKAILADENKRNFPGNDYYEFVVMKNAMNAIPQESVRYQAAFAGWMTGGNQSKDSLLKTAQIYLGLVEREIKEFGEAYQQQYAQQVTANEQLIAQKKTEQQQLAERVAKLNTEIADLTQQNLDSTSSLTTKHDAFMAAGENQRQEILTEVNKINQYIN